MNKEGKSEVTGRIGLLVIVAVTVIVGLILFQGAAQNTSNVLNTVTLVNQSLPAIVVNATPSYVTNCKEISSLVVFNATGNVEILSGSDNNFTVTNRALDSTTNLAVKIVPNVTAAYKSIWKISGVCTPVTYDDSSGGRSTTLLIIILCALAIAAITLVPILKDWADFN